VVLCVVVFVVLCVVWLVFTCVIVFVGFCFGWLVWGCVGLFGFWCVYMCKFVGDVWGKMGEWVGWNYCQ
jgi:hypothetical protein